MAVNPRHRHTRPAMSLIEMVMAMSIISILMLTMGSSILLVARALPEQGGVAPTAARAAGPLDQLAEELQYALHVFERTQRTIGFTLPDRTGDGSPERVRYTWSGVAGDPLTRSWNGGPAVAIVPAVEEFWLGYDIVSRSQTYPGPLDEQAEKVIASHTITSGISGNTVNDSTWFGQYVPASAFDLPENTERWRPTAVDLVVDHSTTLLLVPLPIGLTVQLREATDNNLPAASPFASATMSNTSLLGALLMDWKWARVSYADLEDRDVTEPLTLTVIRQTAGSGGELAFRQAGGLSGKARTTSGESGWVNRGARSLLYRIHGRPLVRQPDQQLTRRYLAGVNMRVRLRGDSTGGSVHTAVHCVNAPELLVGYWETDFSSDPTALDVNGDGQPDWVNRSSLVRDTSPAHDFTQPTTLHARVRSNVAGAMASIAINADWRTGNAAPLYVTLFNAGDGTQTLLVHRRTGPSTFVLVGQRTGLALGFRDVRVLVHPHHETFAVWVDQGFVGTYRYTRFAMSADDRRAVTLSTPTGVEWDRVSVRVGGTTP
jgi:prepilin-type N-terminal cleavage/methylation domain-containing protein